MHKHLKLVLVVMAAQSLMAGCGKGKSKKNDPAVQVEAKNVEGDEKKDPSKDQGTSGTDSDTQGSDPSLPGDEPVNPLVGMFQQTGEQTTLSINPDLTVTTNLVLSNPFGYGNVIAPTFPNALVASEGQQAWFETAGSYIDPRGNTRETTMQLQLQAQETTTLLNVYIYLPNTDIYQYDCYDCCYPCVQPDPFPTSPGSSVRYHLIFERIETPAPTPPAEKL